MRIASGWALALALAVTAAALVGSLMPRVPMPQAPFGDKLVHAAGYAALAVSWRLALQGPSAATLLGVLAFGAAIECVQGLLPWRSFEWADMLANGVGAALGLLAWSLIRRRLEAVRSH